MFGHSTIKTNQTRVTTFSEENYAQLCFQHLQERRLLECDGVWPAGACPPHGLVVDNGERKVALLPVQQGPVAKVCALSLRVQLNRLGQILYSVAAPTLLRQHRRPIEARRRVARLEPHAGIVRLERGIELAEAGVREP